MFPEYEILRAGGVGVKKKKKKQLEMLCAARFLNAVT